MHVRDSNEHASAAMNTGNGRCGLLFKLTCLPCAPRTSPLPRGHDTQPQVKITLADPSRATHEPFERAAGAAKHELGQWLSQPCVSLARLPVPRPPPCTSALPEKGPPGGANDLLGPHTERPGAALKPLPPKGDGARGVSFAGPIAPKPPPYAPALKLTGGPGESAAVGAGVCSRPGVYAQCLQELERPVLFG